jgi:hypothetical protein
MLPHCLLTSLGFCFLNATFHEAHLARSLDIKQTEVSAEKLAMCHSEGRCLPEESAFSWESQRKADLSLRSG